MIRLGTDFFPPDVRAFVSDFNCDFKLTDPFAGLTAHQQEYLKPFGISDSPRWIHLRQMHGKEFVVVDEALIQQGLKVYEADAAITDLDSVPISVRTADCQALFIYAADTETIAVVHAGWKGVRQKIAEDVLRHLIGVKHCNPEFIKVAFGPSIRCCCFEVQENVAQHFPDSVIRKDSRMFVDLIQECRGQLKNCGIEENNIYDCGLCTFCHYPQFFSYRRQGEDAGRMINVMMKG